MDENFITTLYVTNIFVRIYLMILLAFKLHNNELKLNQTRNTCLS